MSQRHPISPLHPAASASGGEGVAVEQRAAEVQLMLRAGLRDMAAFAEIHRLYADRLFAVALKMLFNQEDAQEVLQEAFLKIWERAPKYDPAQSAPLTWSVMQLRSLCLDRMRRIHRHADKLERLRANSTWTSPSHDCPAAQADLSERMALGMSLLAEPERQCVMLAVFSEMTHAEVAETMGVPLGSIKSRLLRGMEKLRTFIRSTS